MPHTHSQVKLESFLVCTHLDKGLHFLQCLSDGTLRKGFQIDMETYGQYIEVHHIHGYDDVFKKN